MELRFNLVVAEDLKAIKEFIAKDNEEMAIRVIKILRKYLNKNCALNITKNFCIMSL